MMRSGVLEIYTRLYRDTTLWASKHISDAAAAKVARHGLARLFQLAMTAWETTNGPYAELRDLCAPMLLDYGLREGKLNFPIDYSGPSLPSLSELRDYCQLYAGVYEVAYFGQWSTPTREYVSMLMRHEYFVVMDGNGLPTLGEHATAALPFLRRALEAHDEHAHGDQLVCEAANQLCDDELARSQGWLDRMTTLGGGGKWLG